MNPTEARTAILTARCAVVYFTKRDGTRRRMVCHAPDEADTRAFSDRRDHLLVWDVEKGDVRTVNLCAVERITPMRTKPHAIRCPGAPVREMLPGRSLTDIAAMFDNRSF